MLIRTTITLAATLVLATSAHAADADLTFTAVDSTYVYASGDSLTDLEAEIDGSTAYCSTDISSAWNLTSAGTCGGASADLGFELAITFPVCADGQSIDFRSGPDYGRGGALFLDGDELDGAADDLWWAGSWTNPAELLTGGDTLDMGYHTLNSIGFEGCCDGAQALQFKVGAGAWTTASSADLGCEYCPAGGALGPADGFNLFVIGDVDVENSDIAGTVAIGGDATFKNYGIGSGLSGGGTTLMVGGDLTITNGQIYGGDADVAGTCTTSSLGVPSGSLTCSTSVATDASDHAGELELISGMMDDLAVTGTTTTTSWGGVSLSGSNPGLNVFELDLDSLGFAGWVWNGWINTFNISTPAGSTVVINVRGDTDPLFKNGSINRSGTAKGDIVWNFFDGQDLTVKNVSVPGAILAPKSDVTASNGNIEGTLVAASFTGSGELHAVSFDGSTCGF